MVDTGAPIYASSALLFVGSADVYMFFATGSDILPATHAGRHWDVQAVRFEGQRFERADEVRAQSGDGQCWQRMHGHRRTSVDVPLGCRRHRVLHDNDGELRPTPCADFTSKLYALTYAGGAAYDANGNGKIDNNEIAGGHDDRPAARRLRSSSISTCIFGTAGTNGADMRRVRRSRRLQQRHRSGRRAHPVLAGNAVVRGAIVCEKCGAKFRDSRDRCPRCRAVIVAPDPAAAAANSKQLTRISAGLVGVFLVGLAVMWVRGESSAPTSGTRPRPSVSGPKSPVSESSARPPAPPEAAANQFLDPSGAGTIAYNAGDYATALARFEEAVQKNPNDAESLSNLGQMFVRLGRTAEAMPHFERATQLDPQRWAYRFNLARALGLLGRWDESIASYQQAQRLFPDDYVTTFNLALALHKVGNETAAVEQYRRAIELNPEDASFHLALATSYERLEKRAEASAAYAEYLRLSPSGAEADKVRARVAELNGSDSAASPAPAGRGMSQD